MMSDHDDIEAELFAEMSDAEQEAELERLQQEYVKMIDSMTREELYVYRRHRAIDLCRKVRTNLREFPDISVFSEILRRTQKRMLSARLEYYHRLRAGNA